MGSAERSGSALFGPIFASAAMREVFSDRGILQAMLDFEAALARAEAEAGIIPADAAAPIAAACDAALYDPVAIGEAAPAGGNIAIPLVVALTAKVAEPGRGCIHWGATSQDVIDTGFMLLARDAIILLARDLQAAMEAAMRLADAHRGTIMAGRTWMQQALPITFGFKAAAWLSALTFAHAEIRHIGSHGLSVQFGGASGTIASLGEKGAGIRARLAAELGLSDTAITWHTDRSRIFAIVAALAALSGTAAKIASDVLLLMQSEVAEAFEPAAAGKGGSSTMPHKRNPVGAAAIRANHRRVAGMMATMTITMEQEHERAPGAWPAEWETLRDLFCLVGGSTERLSEMLAGLEVDSGRMRANLDAQLGLPLAESLMMALAPATGRMQAHHLVEAASKRALAERRPLAGVAAEEPEIARHLSPERIADALDPANYLGAAASMIDAVIAEAKTELETA